MRWFKHYASVSKSNLLSFIYADDGLRGVGRYWRLLEALADKFSKKDDTKFIFKVKDIRQFLGFQSNTSLTRWLLKLQSNGALSFTLVDSILTIETDILLRLQGRDFKRRTEERANNESQDRESINKNINTKNQKKRDGSVKKLKSAPPSASSRPPIIISDIIEVWNRVCGNSMPRIRTLTQTRKTKLKKLLDLLHECDITFENYCFKMANTPFLKGANNRGWKADFDFALNLSKATKIIEGSYDMGYHKTKAEMDQEAMLQMENPYVE